MSQYRNFPFFENEFTKAMSQFKVPGLDVEAMLASQRKNVEAFTAANRLAVEGVQAVMRRQQEIFRQTVEDTSQTLRDVTATAAPDERVGKQLDALREAYDQALTNMQELSEMMTKSNAEASDMIKARISDSLGELKTTLKSATQKTK